MVDLIDEAKRDFLIKLLATGAMAVMPCACANLNIKQSPKMVAGRSIYHLHGLVMVNGVAANENTMIKPTDSISTSRNSQIIFVVGQDAFLLRENSELYLSGNAVVSGLRLLTGALLSIFGKSRHLVTTATAGIDIRGNGLYVESRYDSTYICTCYGTTDISSIVSPDKNETIVSLHHDEARIIDADGNISPAPFMNHNDDELKLLQALVGNTAPTAS